MQFPSDIIFLLGSDRHVLDRGGDFSANHSWHRRTRTSQSSDQLVISERMYDFGWVPDNTKVTHDFTLTNASGSDIDILDVSKSCACTDAAVTMHHLAAGQASSLHVIISTAWRDAFTVYLTTKWKYTATGDEFKVDITAIGRIARSLLIIPNKLNLGNVSQSSGIQTAELILEKPYEAKIESWTDLAISGDAGPLACVLKKESESKWKLIVSLDPHSMPIGHKTSAVSLQCLSENKVKKIYTVYVDANITSDIEAIPKSVYLGSIPSSIALFKTVLLKHPEGMVKILSIESDDENFVTANWVQGNDYTNLNLNFTPNGVQGQKAGKLLVHLEIGGHSNVLALPYFGYVR